MSSAPITRVPTDVLVEIVLRTVSLPDTSTLDHRYWLLSPPVRYLADLNNLGRSCRYLHQICNKILYETAVFLDLIRYYMVSDNAHPRTPPYEATEMILGKSPTTTAHLKHLPNRQPTTEPTPNAWTQRGAVAVSAAASGNLGLLERLLLHFPSDNLIRRITTPKTHGEICLPRCDHAHLRYLHGAYFTPLPCAPHFDNVWRRNYHQATEHDLGVDGQTDQKPTTQLASACWSLMHAAASAGEDEVVEWLLARGAPTEELARGCCMCSSPHMRLLLGHSLSTEPPYTLSTQHPETPVASTPHSLTAGDDGQPWTSLSDRCFFEAPAATPLHLALSRGHQLTARILISHGAVWDRPTSASYGVTGLHIMAAGGMVEMLRWLSERNPSPTDVGLPSQHHDWPDVSGLYAFHYAAVADQGLRLSDNSIKRHNTSSHDSEELIDALNALGAIRAPSLRGLASLTRSELRFICSSDVWKEALAIRNTTRRPRFQEAFTDGHRDGYENSHRDDHRDGSRDGIKYRNGHAEAPAHALARESDEVSECCDVMESQATGLRGTKRSRKEHAMVWIYQLRDLTTDDLGPDVVDECPVSFACRIGNEKVARAVARLG